MQVGEVLRASRRSGGQWWQVLPTDDPHPRWQQRRRSCPSGSSAHSHLTFSASAARRSDAFRAESTSRAPSLLDARVGRDSLSLQPVPVAVVAPARVLPGRVNTEVLVGSEAPQKLTVADIISVFLLRQTPVIVGDQTRRWRRRPCGCGLFPCHVVRDRAFSRKVSRSAKPFAQQGSGQFFS